MTPKEIQLAKSLFEQAIDEFANHGCNDIDESLFENWTKEELAAFSREFHEFNGDLENYDPERPVFTDTMAMSLLLHKMTEQKVAAGTPTGNLIIHGVVIPAKGNSIDNDEFTEAFLEFCETRGCVFLGVIGPELEEGE